MTENNNEEMPADLVSTVPPDESICIIIPLFGYWKDLDNQELTLDVLKVTLSRLNSYFNKVTYLFPCEQPRLQPGIMNYLIGKQLAGNSVGVQVEPFSTYADYVNEGVAFALEETDAKFLMVVNPWIALKQGAIDNLINLLNQGNVAVCSGTDLRKFEVSDADLDSFEFNPPKDFVGLDLNFFGMTRSVAEMMKFDPGYRSTAFLGRDFFEELTKKQYRAMLTQHVLFYSFPLTWSELEDPGDFEQDKQRFLEKWRFEPTEINEDSR